jgi:translation initiation factor 2 beta subunit (eIF-2beta)/eIF-5
MATLIFGVPDAEPPRDPKITAKMLKKMTGTTKVSNSSERLFFNRRQLV